MQRLRIYFSKTSAMRFTGHLDLHRTWERTFRRAGLPLAYTQGFNPHPRLNLAAALPLGFTSECEMADVWLEQEQPLEKLKVELGRALPPGLEVYGLEEVDLHVPTLQTQVVAAEYVVTLLDALPDLDDRLDALKKSEALPRQRRGKSYDLRPLIDEVALLPADEEGHQRLFLRLSAQANATGRPDEIVDALGGDPLAIRAHRTKLILNL